MVSTNHTLDSWTTRWKELLASAKSLIRSSRQSLLRKWLSRNNKIMTWLLKPFDRFKNHRTLRERPYWKCFPINILNTRNRLTFLKCLSAMLDFKYFLFSILPYLNKMKKSNWWEKSQEKTKKRGNSVIFHLLLGLGDRDRVIHIVHEGQKELCHPFQGCDIRIKIN